MEFLLMTDTRETQRCAYCGSTKPENGFTSRDIIHRKFVPGVGQRVATTKKTVCNNNACGGYLQMSYEG